MSKIPYKIIKWFWIDEDLHIRAILTTQSKKWYLQFQQVGCGKGRQRRKSLGTTSEKQARILGQRFARNFEAGQIPTTSMQAATVEKIIALKLDRLESDLASAHTLLLYRWYFNMLITYLPRQGKTTIGMLTPLMLTSFAKKLRTDGIAVVRDGGPTNRKPRPLCGRTVREVLKAVRGLTRLARSLKLIAVDPTDGFILPKGTSKEVEVFTPSELHFLFADPVMGHIWTFLAHTGLRIEEFCWLTKADVVFNPQGKPVAVQIRRKINAITKEEWRPKHKVERVVYLSKTAAQVVADALKNATGLWAFQTSGTEKNPAGKWPGARIRAALKRRLKAGKISHGSPHIFRHSCATFLANSSAMTAVQVQRHLGHRDFDSTRRYVHTNNEDVARGIAAVDFSVFAAPPTNKKSLSQTPSAVVAPAPNAPVPAAADAGAAPAANEIGDRKEEPK